MVHGARGGIWDKCGRPKVALTAVKQLRVREFEANAYVHGIEASSAVVWGHCEAGIGGPGSPVECGAEVLGGGRYAAGGFWGGGKCAARFWE
jgi:hypothetical protein